MDKYHILKDFIATALEYSKHRNEKQATILHRQLQVSMYSNLQSLKKLVLII